MSDAEKQRLPATRWQVAKQIAADLLAELPVPADGTPVYIATDGLDQHSIVLFRAFVRAAEREGKKVKLL